MKDKLIRKYWVDNLRGFGILLVILGHIRFSEGVVQTAIYSFHMPLFFFLSGFLLNNKKEYVTEWEYLKKRFIQLMWPYFTFSFICIFYLFFTHQYGNLKLAIFETVTLQGSGNLWFIPCLFFSEVISFTLLKRKEIIQFLYIIISLVVTSLCSMFIYSNVCEGIIFNVLNFVIRIHISSIFVYSGYWFYKFEIKLVNKKIDLCLFILSIFVIVFNMYFCQINSIVDLHMSKMNNPFFYYYFSFTTVYAFALIFRKYNKNLLLALFGRESLSLMCLTSFLPIIYYGILICENIMIENQYIKLLFAWIFTCFISLIISWIIRKYFKIIITPPSRRGKK